MGEIDRLQGAGSVKREGALVYGADTVVGPWIARRVARAGWNGEPTIGVVRGGRLVAGAMFENYNGIHCNCTIAAEEGSRWADRAVLRGLFAYPFLQLDCVAMSALVASSNLKSLNLAAKLGFTAEAIVRFAAHDQSDVIVMKMHRKNCRWI